MKNSLAFYGSSGVLHTFGLSEEGVDWGNGINETFSLSSLGLCSSSIKLYLSSIHLNSSLGVAGWRCISSFVDRVEVSILREVKASDLATPAGQLYHNTLPSSPPSAVTLLLPTQSFPSSKTHPTNL